ncbi:longitudinals lacking protein, isoforms A/B/D/L-like [Ctenocephalides felis]|uniref:longitudinals lacking protein, isoforms A/B/D/L-like n=1 Tax=Ctenocephalides felis TaxID=7515 RepID=UPI000E6E1B7A|nr:longitudinals lacking protein, isoforms A/B/D/L-like [Ctenocephalides felis]
MFPSENTSCGIALKKFISDVESLIANYQVKIAQPLGLSSVKRRNFRQNYEHTCKRCSRRYKYRHTLSRHMKYECGMRPAFGCPFCDYRAKQRFSLLGHVQARHKKDFQYAELLKCLEEPPFSLT